MKEILLTSSALILALLALRQLFRRTVSRRMQYALWLLVLARLLVPVNVGTLAHNVLSAAEPVQRCGGAAGYPRAVRSGRHGAAPRTAFARQGVAG